MGRNFGRAASGFATGGLTEIARAAGGGGNQGRFYMDPGERPKLGAYNSLRDKESGLLANKNLNLTAGPDINLNTQGLEAIRKRALTEGPSTWAALQNQRQALEEAQARTDAGAQAASAGAQARSQLASRGGLTGGSAERLAASNAKNLMRSRQQVGAQGALDRSNTALQDEQMRMDLLKTLPGMEVQSLQPQFQNRQMGMQAQQFNIEQALKDKYAEDQYNMAKYQEDMKSYAAAQQANAIGGAGGGKKG